VWAVERRPRRLRISPAKISYVEDHGTGTLTQLNCASRKATDDIFEPMILMFTGFWEGQGLSW
jgi:hypothetical protein